MTASATRTRTPVPHRAATTLLTLGVPAASTTVAVVLALSWRSDLPDPIVTHWGPTGPDAVGPVSPHILAHAVIVLAFGLFMWAIGFFGGRDALTRRIVAAVAAFFGVLLSGVLIGNLAVQRGLTDASEVGGADLGLGLGFGAAVVVAILAAWVTPGDRPQPTTEPVPADAPRLELAAGEQVVWVRQAGQQAALVIVALAAALAAVAGVITRTWGGPLVLGGALALLLLVMVRWTVVIDSIGLTARSVLRRPTIHVPLDEVLLAEEVQVNPLREFGGWGLRRGLHGRTGIVLRSGSALQVRRTGDRVLVVTVDDAATGAALLNALAERSRTDA